MTVSAISVTSIGDVSHKSTQSNQFEVEKISEQMDMSFDGQKNIISITNIGKYDSEIAMFRFYDNAGTEVHRTILPDADGRSFGSGNPLVGNSTLSVDEANLYSHTPVTYSLEDIGIDSVDGMTVEIVTKRGRVFPMVFDDNNTSNSDLSSSNSTSILDGLGVSLSIQNFVTPGTAYYGWGTRNPGTQTDIRPYIVSEGASNWFSTVSTKDPVKTFVIPEFGREYHYDGDSLNVVSSERPNALGYRDTRAINGSSIVSINNGIQVSGAGTTILKFYDYHKNTVLLRGDAAQGGVFKIITSDIDLMTEPYYNDGYLTYSTNGDPTPTSLNIVAGIDSEHTGHFKFKQKYDYKRKLYHQGSTAKWQYGLLTNWVVLNSDLVKTDNGDHKIITGDNTNPYDIRSGYQLIPRGTVQHSFSLYDTLPSYLHANLTGTFEKVFTFPKPIVTGWTTQPIYLYVYNPNDSTMTIRSEAFRAHWDIFFKVTGLDAHTAYDISKDGITRTVGMTDENGTISLLYDDAAFNTLSAGGILRIYPDSLKHVERLGTVMMDMLHGESVMLDNDHTRSMAYIPQNYVRWVFPVAVNVTNVMVDDLPLPYLNREYPKSDALVIPVIPSAHVIYATINGTDAEVQMRDVSVATQIKQVPKKSSTSSKYSNSGGSTVTTSSDISTSTFLVSTHNGTAIANIDLKISGTADFSMSSEYTGPIKKVTICRTLYQTERLNKSCGTHDVPVYPDSLSNLKSLTSKHVKQVTAALDKGQLSKISVYVDVIKNMEYVKTEVIHSFGPSNAELSPAFETSKWGASNKVRVQYPITGVSGVVAVPVVVGDMIEYVVRANLSVTGVPVPASSSAGYGSFVQATTDFGGGVITVGTS